MMRSHLPIGWWWSSCIVLIATLNLLFGRAASQDAGSNLIPALPNSDLISKLVKFLEGGGIPSNADLRRVYLTGNATCNDGTPAGYYMRKSAASQRWIVFLEGGWYCYDEHSCASRWSRMQHLMSSKKWPEVRNVGGILSAKVEENPYWWNANHVFVPYCTSDSWSGRRSEPDPQLGFSFMGATIVEQVVRDLLTLGLGNGSSLLLAGSSAGGAGVMLNLEMVQGLLDEYPKIAVRGITDSGWFLDRAPYSSQADTLASVEAIKKGMVLWEGQVPSACRSVYHGEPWRCFFGYRLYPTVTAPLFVFQWLFDEAQMTADNVGAPMTKQQWDYVHKMGDSLRNSFKNVTSVFAPSCISHSVLTKRDWRLLKIDEVSLPQALRCWELSSRRLHRPRHKNLRGNKRKNGKTLKSHNSSVIAEGQHKKRRRKNGMNLRRKKRRRIANKHQWNKEGCRHRLVERCSWPQCNHSCPKLHNPFTGEEMDFIELLKSFGLDMKSVANALGIDIHTLNNMDHEELLNLLTQQAS
ncbi:Pectinacetylesterase [Nesidiocoris tenuis]|uniref:Pectinacetylesterase n=1 Tax=Nesidiocoris tenuis TaxID=355587 RepID=A0ABN7B928_9HEMI|nr:Pectinacetylesterase [Nesidiocoris tenuis]